MFDHPIKSLVYYLSNALCHALLMLHNNTTRATLKKLDKLATLVTNPLFKILLYAGLFSQDGLRTLINVSVTNP